MKKFIRQLVWIKRRKEAMKKACSSFVLAGCRLALHKMHAQMEQLRKLRKGGNAIDAAVATARAATWSAAQALLVLEGDVTLTRGADTLSGARLEYHPPTGRVTLERARGRFSAPRLALPPATPR